MKSVCYMPGAYLYYSYGDDLLTSRILIRNTKAEFVSIARLDNYRLDFIKYSAYWGGPTATLVPTANAHVWGVIWSLHENDVISLNDQRGVNIKKYYIKNVKVLTPHLGTLNCRTHVQKINPLPRGDNDKIPVEQWPSWTYKEVMIMGAMEHSLPEYYIDYLKTIKDNGEQAYLRTDRILSRYEQDQPCECKVPGRIPRKSLKLDLRKVREKGNSNKRN